MNRTSPLPLPTAFLLRDAVSDDAPALAAILRGWIESTPWFPNLPAPQADVSFLGHKIASETVRVAEDAATGAVLGFLSREGDYVSCLYVDGAAQNRGVGRALIQEAQTACDRLSLWTFQANDQARAFYDAMGFAQVQCTDGSDNEEKLPDVEFLWQRDGSAQ